MQTNKTNSNGSSQFGKHGAKTSEPRKDGKSQRAAGSARPAGQQAADGVKNPPKQKQNKPQFEKVLPRVGAVMELPLVEQVEKSTRGQRENPAWYSWRKNRITASVAHRVSHSRFANGGSRAPPASYLQSIAGESSPVTTRAMRWGVDMESAAAQQYQKEKSRQLRKKVRVQECGLFIHPEHPWLAASPDGIVEDVASGERLSLLEIKCPYKHRHQTVHEACQQDRDFCLELETPGNGERQRYRLKPKHSYYTQVQCQMAVVGLHEADFVVFTNEELAIVPVMFDPGFWESTQGKLEFFYRQAVEPYVQESKRGAAALQREI